MKFALVEIRDRSVVRVRVGGHFYPKVGWKTPVFPAYRFSAFHEAFAIRGPARFGFICARGRAGEFGLLAQQAKEKFSIRVRAHKQNKSSHQEFALRWLEKFSGAPRTHSILRKQNIQRASNLSPKSGHFTQKWDGKVPFLLRFYRRNLGCDIGGLPVGGQRANHVKLSRDILDGSSVGSIGGNQG
jgi:hypothetical protein